MFQKINRINKTLVFFVYGVCLWAFQAEAIDQIALGSSKFLGNITSGTPPSNYADYWNQITLENGGKWGLIQPSNQTTFNWAQTDSAYKYCKSKGWPFKHHCFVWGQQQPGWMEGLSAAAQKTAVENYIKAYGSRYPETAFIDVVNEPFNAPASYREALGGSGTTGWDWVVTVFQFARQYCPNAKLLINEFGIEYGTDLAVAYLGIIRILQEKNLIDGIGVQSHCFILELTPPDTVKRVLDTLASTGLPIYSSEFDLTGDENTQLERYRTYFPIFWEHRAVKGVTLWGWTSNWKGAIIMAGAREYAALKWIRTYVDSLEKTPPLTTRVSVAKSEETSSRVILNNTGRGSIPLNAAKAGNLTLRIVDPVGRTVFRSTERFSPFGDRTFFLPLQSLCRGMYVLSITGEGVNMTQKFFVHR